MTEEEKWPIKKEWEEYYITLESIRRSGIVNMWGAYPYLQAMYPGVFSDEEAREILCNWIHNYDELNRKYNWQN